MDVRLDPANAHPLNAVDCVRSQARIADIQLGLAGSDADWWQDKARRRIQALEEDDAAFGMAPHEEAELEQLKAMLVSVNERLAANG